MRKSLTAMALAIIGIAAFLSGIGNATAKQTEDNGSDITVPGPEDISIVLVSPEDFEMLLMGGGTTMALSSVGTTTTNNGHQACWVSYDAYRDRYRIPAGDAYGRYTSGGRYVTSDAYYDSADCGDGVEGGRVPLGENLEFFLTSAYAIDQVDDDGGRVYFQLALEYYCGAGCAGTCVDFTNVTDQAYCSSTTSGITWREALDLEGDGDNCHRPDIVLSSSSGWYPSSRTTVGYMYSVKTWVCDSNGTNCSYLSDTGCVDIEFY
jgi:hypothetical protein